MTRTQTSPSDATDHAGEGYHEIDLMIALVAIGVVLMSAAALAEVLLVVAGVPPLVIVGLVLAGWYLTGPHKVTTTVRAVLTTEPLPPPPPPWEGCECQCDACKAAPSPKHGHGMIVEVDSGKIILGGGHNPSEMAYAAWASENYWESWGRLSPEGRAFKSAQLDWNAATLHETYRRKKAGDPNWQSWLPPHMPSAPGLRLPPLPGPDFLLRLLRRLFPEHYEAYAARRTADWEAQREEAARVWYVRVSSEISAWSARWEREAAQVQERHKTVAKARRARPMTAELARVLAEQDGLQLLRDETWGGLLRDGRELIIRDDESRSSVLTMTKMRVALQRSGLAPGDRAWPATVVFGTPNDPVKKERAVGTFKTESLAKRVVERELKRLESIETRDGHWTGEVDEGTIIDASFDDTNGFGRIEDWNWEPDHGKKTTWFVMGGWRR